MRASVVPSKMRRMSSQNPMYVAGMSVGSSRSVSGRPPAPIHIFNTADGVTTNQIPRLPRPLFARLCHSIYVGASRFRWRRSEAAAGSYRARSRATVDFRAGDAVTTTSRPNGIATSVLLTLCS